MSIRLEIDGDSVVEFDEETIILGSDPSCTVPFPTMAGLELKHAVIRRIAGRWLVEVREADSIQVGDAEPSRMHWLSRGDVIRLTDNGPEVKFEPDRPPTKTGPPRGNVATPSAGVSRPALRSTATPAESNTLQLSKPTTVVLPPLEDAVEVYELKSATPTAKPSRPAPTKGDDESKNAPPSRPPASRPAPSRSEGDDEIKVAPSARPLPPLPPLPPLVKSTSWLDSTSAASSRRKRAARRFWMQMAGVGVLAVVAIAIWQFGRGGSDANSRAESNPNSGKGVSAHNNQASSNSADKPHRPDPVRDSNPTKSVKPVETSDTKSSDSPKPAPDPVAAVGVAPPKTGGKGPSATLVAVRDGVYAVIAKHSNEEDCFRIGTAWAASRRNLVTSGAVALAVEELQREGLTIVVSQPFQDRPIAIKGVRLHAAYRQAIERAAVAREQIAAADSTSPVKSRDSSGLSLEEELARSMATQSRFDLGVLDIAVGGRLPNPLKMDSNDLPDAAKNDFLMVGFPFPADEYRTKTALITDDAKERLSPKNASAKSDSNLALTMGFPEDVADHNWSGSPVFNRDRQVIGVYSRAAKPAERIGKKPPLPRHAVIWLGRLREFAPDVEE